MIFFRLLSGTLFTSFFLTAFSDEKYRLHNLLEDMNVQLLELNKISAEFEWESAINPSSNISSAKTKLNEMKTRWKLKWCNVFSRYQQDKESVEAKMIYSLCKGPEFLPEEARQLTVLSEKILQHYQSTKICRIEKGNKKKCYHGEPDLKYLMATSRNESELKWAWTSWRNEMSKVEKDFFHSVLLQNQGARRNGYKDTGEIWRNEMNIPDLENFAEELWNSIKCLYRFLHAVVRFKLRKIYPNVIDPYGLIPAHLLGDLWSQNWVALTDIVLPNPNVTLNISKIFKKKKYSVFDMVKRSEDFYISLGFPSMPKKFWDYSVLTKVNGSTGNCHGSAANMYVKDDFRVLGCFDINEEDFHVVHHEMGHIQYYMAYQNQPAIFRNGVNSAFHESVGDAILLGVMTSQHLQRLGLAGDEILNDDISILLRQALNKLPQIPHALLIEKWRWRVFENNINPQDYNKVWWELHRDFMGIKPPMSRKGFFDPAAKFHIVNNTPYIRYFIAYFLQFQIFEGMCEAAVSGKIQGQNINIPLHKCDIYGSKNAGKNLRNVMKMGSRIHAAEALIRLTGFADYSSKPLQTYFEPVRQFLQQQIELYEIPVGWK